MKLDQPFAASSLENGRHHKKATRVQVDMPAQSMNRLKRLKDLSEAATYAEVLKTGLKAYERILMLQAGGGQLVYKQEDGTEMPVMEDFRP